MPPESKDCLLCGSQKPPGHVAVYTVGGAPAGRICSSHTLREVIMDPSERFLVDIELIERESRWPESAQAQRQEASGEESPGG